MDTTARSCIIDGYFTLPLDTYLDSMAEAADTQGDKPKSSSDDPLVWIDCEVCNSNFEVVVGDRLTHMHLIDDRA